MKTFNQAVCLALALPCMGALTQSAPAMAQIIPDGILGDEGSLVTPGMAVRGAEADLIEGGAIRGGNLFHSFQEFNIDAGQRVYFANPEGIESILSRVTGGDPSNIFGTLGVDGTADLFLLNPNGIVFGETAALDIEGSFYATTAEAIPLGNGVYSATAPEQSSLLTVNPSALFRNYLTETSGDIENRGQLIAGNNLVFAGKNLDIQGPIVAFGNLSLLSIDKVRVSNLVGSFENVTIQSPDLIISGEDSEVFLQSLTNLSKGEIRLEVDRLSLLNGGQVTTDTITNINAGNIIIEASGWIRVAGSVNLPNGQSRSGIQADTRSLGNAGDITITTPYLFVEDGSRIGSQVQDGANGNGGTVVVNVRDLNVQSGGQVTAGTFGPGRGGVLQVNATGAVEVNGSDGAGSPSGILTATYGYGDGNDIIINTNRLSVLNGGQVSASTLGIEEGKGGNLFISANDFVEVAGTSDGSTRFISTISSDSGSLLAISFRGAVGDGGNLKIETRDLTVRDGGRISTEAFGTGVRPDFFGIAGDAGDLKIIATGNIRLINGSLRARTSGLGDAGNLEITANNFYARGSAEATTFSRGEGDGGNLSIIVSGTIDLTDGGGLGAGSLPPFGSLDAGDAGDLLIQTTWLRVRNGSGITTAAIGFGRSGNLNIQATDSVEVIGGEFVSGSEANSRVGREIYDPEEEVFRSSFISSDAGNFSDFPAGDLNINTRALSVIDGGRITATSLASNPGGNLNISALETVNVVGMSRNGDVSSIEARAISIGNAGNIHLETNQLNLLDGGEITASSRDVGNAGNLTFIIRENLQARNGTISTSAERASGGLINIQAQELVLIGDSDIQTNVNNGLGNGGDINITANAIVALDDSDILAFSADGIGGNILLNTPAFFGEGFQPQSQLFSRDALRALERNGQVDVNATGAVASGTITIPDISFIENDISPFDAILVDTETLTAGSCIARTEIEGTFTVTGRDGLPQRPGDMGIAAYPTGTVQTVEADGASLSRMHPTGGTLQEPDGVYQLPDGRLVLSRECSDS